MHESRQLVPSADSMLLRSAPTYVNRATANDFLMNDACVARGVDDDDFMGNVQGSTKVVPLPARCATVKTAQVEGVFGDLSVNM
jgi:hypothetical protein